MAFDLGLITFVLPFLFMLAIAYGALDLANIFKKRQVNVIIALVISFFAVVNIEVVEFIIAAMPYMAMLFIVLFFVKFVLSFFKSKDGEKKDYTLILVILLLLGVFMASQGTELIKDWMPMGSPLTEENIIWLIGIVVIIAILYAAYKKMTGDNR